MIPITLNTPKPLVRVKGTRIIDTMLDAVVAAGSEEIIIGTGHCNEFYDDLAKRYPQVKTIKNENYMNTSSMGTLACCAPLIKGDFLLLESDLIYDIIGLKVLLSDYRPNVMLASGKSNSHDEVYLEADGKDILQRVSKDKTVIPFPAGELVGITKVTKQAFDKMLAYYSSNPDLIKLDYEHALEYISTNDDEPIYVRKVEYYAWTEIDDESMLNRAMLQIWPRIVENEELYKLV